MILYTPLPLEQVLEGMDKKYNYKEIDVEGVKLLIEPIDIDQGKIVRVISSNPQDFLKPNLSPGSIIKFKI